MQGSATQRTSTDFVVTHPLDVEDAVITTAFRAMVSSTKGVSRGIEMRGQFDAIMESVLPRDNVTFEAEALGGIPGIWVHPANGRSDEAILHLHGGWFNFGSANAYRHLVGHIAARAGVRAFIPDYRLAPEHPFPAATDDVLACYRGLAGSGRSPDCAHGQIPPAAISHSDSPRASPAKPSPPMRPLSGLPCCIRLPTSPFRARPMRRARMPIPCSLARRSRNSCIPIWEAPTRNIHWLRHFTVNLPGCHPSAFMSVMTKCCWTTRSAMLSVQLPQASMPGLMCGWGCRTGFPGASES